jgi:membrane fusion protein, multidrug efflux system
MKNKNLLQLSILALVAALFAACGGTSQDPAAQLAALKDQKTQIEAQIVELEKQVNAGKPVEKKVKTVGLTEVQPAQFRHYIDLQGKVDAEDNVPVTAKGMGGNITKILVKNGDNVRQGQLLAVLDDAVMEKTIAQLETQLKTAEDVYNRQKGLWDQKIGTEIQLIQAKAQKDGIEQQIATLREQWGQSRIYAPIGGTVDLVLLKVGQAIAPGMPLCNIVSLNRLKVKGDVTEAYAAKVKNGDAVAVFFPDLNKEITTRISYISRTINPMTRTFAVECNLPSGPDYRANMVAVMKIIDYQANNALVVPVNLLQSAEDGDFLLVAEKTGDKQATAKKVAVKQGQNYNGMVEIKSGLQKGDWVISTGFQDVNNGETIAF